MERRLDTYIWYKFEHLFHTRQHPQTNPISVQRPSFTYDPNDYFFTSGTTSLALRLKKNLPPG